MAKADIKPQALSGVQAARYCGYNRFAWGQAKRQGLLPKPRMLPGRSLPVYLVSDLDDWLRKLPKADSNLPRQRQPVEA